MRRLPSSLLILASLTIASACADEPADDSTDGADESDTHAPGESGTDTHDSHDGHDETETGDTEEPLEPPDLLLCGTPPPPGAQLAPPLPTYAGPGTCPTLETGSNTLNVMQTDHGEREFFLVTPSDYSPDEELPVVFMYHWLGGDAIDFYQRAEAQYAADFYRFIAIIPEGRTSDQGMPFRWPFTVLDTPADMDEEFAFHDDMLACVHEQFGVDKECVSTMGVSAGAMFSAMLASRHGDHLSSMISLSGGTGGDFVQPWVSARHSMPALVLWGGRSDVCLGVDFDANSKELEAGLAADNHFIVECVHNCTHATPPFEHDDSVIPTYAPAWEFFLDHPYWLEDGESPYLGYVEATGGLPSAWPEWCAIGPGNATIRQGMCGGSEC
jgi:pimeloyl-ACP methyl ester carboxylesterase